MEIKLTKQNRISFYSFHISKELCNCWWNFQCNDVNLFTYSSSYLDKVLFSILHFESPCKDLEATKGKSTSSATITLNHNLIAMLTISSSSCETFLLSLLTSMKLYD